MSQSFKIGDQVRIINPIKGDYTCNHTVCNYNEVTNRCYISPNESTIKQYFLIDANELIKL